MVRNLILVTSYMGIAVGMGFVARAKRIARKDGKFV